MLTLILTKETNKTEQNKQNKQNETKVLDSEENEKEPNQVLLPNNTNNISINQRNGESYIEVDDDEIQNIEIESIEFVEPLDLTIPEMDMILLCAFISQTALKKNYSQDIIDIAEKIGEPDIKHVHDKIGFSFFNICLTNIDNETVSKYISNLTYHNNFVWEKKFDDYIKLDKEKYQNISDIKFSIDDQIISKVVRQSNQEFEKRKMERNKNYKSKKQKQNEIPKKENANINKNIKNKTMDNNSIINEILFFFYFGLIISVFFFVFNCCRKKNTNINNKDKNVEKNGKKNNKKKKED
jgi:hypothetical protein